MKIGNHIGKRAQLNTDLGYFFETIDMSDHKLFVYDRKIGHSASPYFDNNKQKSVNAYIKAAKGRKIVMTSGDVIVDPSSLWLCPSFSVVVSVFSFLSQETVLKVAIAKAIIKIDFFIC